MNILVVSLRDIDRTASYCFVTEFEEFLALHYAVDLYTPSGLYPLNRNLFRAAKYASNSNEIAEKVACYPTKFNPSKEYDLILCMAVNPWQLQLLFGIRDWRNFGRKTACYVQEVWPSDIDNWRLLKEPFAVYDHVFTGLSSCTEQLQDSVDTPCRFIANGVDTLAFSPFGDNHDRVIDVYSPGRRIASFHEQCVQYSKQHRKFYLFDTNLNQKLFIDDHMQHRKQYLNYLQRTRYSFAFPAKFNLGSQTAGIQEPGTRYYELTAAGCIVLGGIPNCDYFKTLFHWDDAVIPLAEDEKALVEILEDLDQDEQRRDTICRNNVANSLKLNDWIYRWQIMLDDLGLQDDGEAETRVTQLREHALEIAALT